MNLSFVKFNPFGMVMPGRGVNASSYRFGFNSFEIDNEVYGNGNFVSYGNYGYNPRLGRRLNIDKFASKFLFQSPYIHGSNSPIASADSNGDSSVVVVKGRSNQTYTSPTGEIFVIYDVQVFENMTAVAYDVLNSNGTLPVPNYTTQLARDANDLTSQGQTIVHSADRYGANNEAPPGTYFLFRPGTKGDQGGGNYQLYLGDQDGSRIINGPDGQRIGIAIHQYDPRDSQGCLTTCSGINTQPIINLINAIPDLNNGIQPVQIILQPREIQQLQYSNPANGPIKFKGTVSQDDNDEEN